MGAKDISPEVVERMVALVRCLHADHVKHGAHDYVQDFVARTAAIVAELPEPVDPDLVECREILAAYYEDREGPSSARQWRSGDWDNQTEMAICLAAMKRGRQLSQDQPS